ncbi:hypothethical protein [Ralstonia solanacearum PSI07]|nr:hypothethical protein [Ralstonia solanacearum PSI07]
MTWWGLRGLQHFEQLRAGGRREDVV